MRRSFALALSPEIQVSVLSPVFQRETKNEIKIVAFPQQQQYDRYAHLTPVQMQEVIRQQQM